MKRTLACLILLALLSSSTASVWAAPPAGPAAQGGAVSNSFGNPNDAYMEFSISGADLKLREGSSTSYEGTWSGGPITLSGKMIVDRSQGTLSYVTMSADVGDQMFRWPPAGEDGAVQGRVVSQSFNLTFNVPPDYTGSMVTGGARLEVCGGVCGNYRIDFTVNLPTPQPTAKAATPTARPKTPTAEPAASPTPEPQYRLSIGSYGEKDPLRLVVRLEKQAASGERNAFEPVPNAQLRISALSYQGNERRLADEFVASGCQNCEWRDAGGSRLAHLTAADQPLLVQTDGQGQADLAFFLDFAKLGANAPLGGTPLSVPIAAEYRAADGPGGERLLARAETTINLDAIAVVTAITYEQAQMYGPGGNALPRNQGPLDSYWDDPGTRDGPRVLSGADRVRIARAGGDYMGAPGQTLGDRLEAGDVLRVGDQVAINACDMVTNRLEGGLPAGAPGVIWVKVRFFDGLRAKVGVNGSVCRSTVMFGQSPAASGWLGSGAKFFYWSVNGAANAVIGNYFWPYKIVSGLNSVGKTLAWLLGNEAAGWEPVYIKVKSALVVEFDENGVMQVTTREGEPAIVTASSGEEGVTVPAGKTGQVTGAQAIDVQDTGAETAQRADGLLADLDPLTDVIGSDGAATTNDFSLPSLGSDLASEPLAVPVFLGCGGLLAVLLLAGLLLVRSRSRKRPARRAEDDWRQDIPAATPPPPIPAAANRGAKGSQGRTTASGKQERWHLVVVEGPDVGKRFPLGAQARLGRSADNDVHLNDPQASRQHAVIQQLMGRVVINDLGSSNGTFVNGSRIAAPAGLREGDTIRLGHTTLQLVIATTAAPEPTPPPPGAPQPVRPGAPQPAGAGGRQAAPLPAAELNYCPHCGHSLLPGASFCAVCGAALGGGAAPPAAYQPAPPAARSPAAPVGRPTGGEAVVTVISFLERRKGLVGSDAFTLVLTPERLVLARLTSDMVKAASEEARQEAKAQGKGFFGQWGAQLGASRVIAQRYYQMPVEAILGEHPDNFQIPLSQIQKVQVKHGQYDEEQNNPDYLIIQAGNKMRFNLKGISAGEAKKALKQVLGDRVR